MNERMRLLIAYAGQLCQGKSEALVVSVCDAVVPPDTVPAIDVRNGPIRY